LNKRKKPQFLSILAYREIKEYSVMADVLSTAIYNMPLDEGLSFIENTPDTEAFWLLSDNEKVQFRI